MTRTVKGQNNLWEQNAFQTCYWRLLLTYKLEQLEFKLEFLGEDLETFRKVRKN